MAGGVAVSGAGVTAFGCCGGAGVSSAATSASVTMSTETGRGGGTTNAGRGTISATATSNPPCITSIDAALMPICRRSADGQEGQVHHGADLCRAFGRRANPPNCGGFGQASTRNAGR